MVPLHTQDGATAALVARFAKLRGLTKQAAVKMAVQAELQRTIEAVPLRDRLALLWKEHPLPSPTGQVADRAFFDELSGGL